MKVRITLKDSDGILEAVSEATKKHVNSLSYVEEHEKDKFYKFRLAQMQDKLSEWIKYEREITVEFDLREGTATVVPVQI